MVICKRLMQDLDRIRDSLLAPWQKLDAIRTFIQPGLTYALWTCPVTKKSLDSYRKKLIQVLKSICNLPTRASTSYFLADKSVGGLGLQNPFEVRYVQKIVHTVKILSATDPFTKNIAHGQLHSVVERCLKRHPSEDEIDAFLPGSTEDQFMNHSSVNNGQTLWSCCRIAAKRLKVKIANALHDPEVSVNESSLAKAKSVSSYLHRHCSRAHADSLSSLPIQGKVARCLKTTNFPSTNSWLFDGTGLSFCDWRFIHRAQTNTLPTNAVKNRFGNNTSSECRNCHSKIDAKILPHIICHCNPNMPSITKRHDKILDRLSKVTHRGSFTIDKAIPGAPGINRPDLVVTDGNKVTIIDVTCPFENDQDALSSAAARKQQKYNYLIDHFRSLNMQAKIFGFVVGPLGAWYSGNELVLDELLVSKRYRTLFRKLCCADSIHGSRNIYVQHLTGIEQY